MLRISAKIFIDMSIRYTLIKLDELIITYVSRCHKSHV